MTGGTLPFMLRDTFTLLITRLRPLEQEMSKDRFISL